MVATINEAVAIIARVASLPGNADYLADTQRRLRLAGVTAAVATRNTAALYRWFINGFSYQAISDQTALAYITNHGNADWPTVEALLGAGMKWLELGLLLANALLRDGRTWPPTPSDQNG